MADDDLLRTAHARLWVADQHGVTYWDPYSGSFKSVPPRAEESDVVSRETAQRDEAVDHPAHYGGADNPYEVIKVLEAWDLGFHRGNVVKYIARAGRKGDEVEDLKKASWYLQRRIQQIEERKK